MPAAIVRLAEAILAELNADPLNNFGLEFEAERTNGEFEYALEDKQIRVDVVPAGHPVGERGDRAGNVGHQMDVQIVLRRGFRANAKIPNTEVDPLRLVVQKIHRHFVGHVFDAWEEAIPVASVIETDGHADTLRVEHTYMAVVRVTYEVFEK